MYTEEKARKLTCFLNEDVYNNIKRLCSCGVCKNQNKSSFKSPEFLDLEYCIASSCKHWKFNEDQTYGWCGAMDG